VRRFTWLPPLTPPPGKVTVAPTTRYTAGDSGACSWKVGDDDDDDVHDDDDDGGGDDDDDDDDNGDDDDDGLCFDFKTYSLISF
jgi:hypothetical protein